MVPPSSESLPSAAPSTVHHFVAAPVDVAGMVLVQQHAPWQQRVTAVFRREHGRSLHVRKATRAETGQQAIYDALGIDASHGGVRKLQADRLAA